MVPSWLTNFDRLLFGVVGTLLFFASKVFNWESTGIAGRTHFPGSVTNIPMSAHDAVSPEELDEII
jgi:hypothetical protein